MVNNALRHLTTCLSTRVAAKINPWRGSEGTYILAYRPTFEGIASKLSARARKVSVRYNVRRACVSFVMDKEIIAEVRVHGSECVPYETLISPCALSSDELKLFSQATNLPKIRIGPVPPFVERRAA